MTVLSSADRAAEDTVRDSDEDLMVKEKNVFKVPVLKRVVGPMKGNRRSSQSPSLAWRTVLTTASLTQTHNRLKSSCKQQKQSKLKSTLQTKNCF